jgi:hypothetical protein
MKTYVAAALCGIFVAGVAHATPTTSITGQLDMTGVVNVENSKGQNTDNNLADGTQLAFDNPFLVDIAYGSLDKSGLLGHIQSPLVFAPKFTGPIDNFFTVDNIFDHVNISFDLTSLTVNTQNSDTLSLTGEGVLHETGYADTYAEWIFSTQAGQCDFALTWSGDAFPSPVPEPASIALFGAGILGLGLSLKRRRLGCTA